LPIPAWFLAGREEERARFENRKTKLETRDWKLENGDWKLETGRRESAQAESSQNSLKISDQCGNVIENKGKLLKT
jgi:polyphosphate kinase 2 (PPK2 family)